MSRSEKLSQSFWSEGDVHYRAADIRQPVGETALTQGHRILENSLLTEIPNMAQVNMCKMEM